jgi:hypothetical protein
MKFNYFLSCREFELKTNKKPYNSLLPQHSFADNFPFSFVLDSLSVHGRKLMRSWISYGLKFYSAIKSKSPTIALRLTQNSSNHKSDKLSPFSGLFSKGSNLVFLRTFTSLFSGTQNLCEIKKLKL